MGLLRLNSFQLCREIENAYLQQWNKGSVFLVSTMSTCQTGTHTAPPSWKSGTHVSSVNTNEGQNPLCVKTPQMWNQSPVDLRTIGSFSCFKTELKQYLMMTGSCHNCFNWCYSCVISVYCVFICVGLSQVMLENGLSASFTDTVSKSIKTCMYVSQPHLFISDGVAICTLHTFHALMFTSHR